VELLVIVLVVVGVVLLASVPFIARARSRRGGVPGEPSGPTPPSPLPPSRLGTATLDRPTPVLEEPPSALEEAPPLEARPLDEGLAAPPRFRDRLGKARSLVSGYLGSILGRSVDEQTWEELEEALIRADVGVESSTRLVQDLRAKAVAGGVKDPDQLLELLKSDLKSTLAADRDLRLDDGATNVWLFVGVNGVGKTTTIGKVGRRLTDSGHTVVMAAGDTFRAAAAEQLSTWADRAGAHLVRGQEGADPSSVIFDGVQSAAGRSADVVLGDTAGRLHTKVNLMEELRKVRRVADRDPGHVTEVLLVIDATTGQNGLQQARLFTDAVDVTGVVLTKLDGTAKGGIVFAIQQDLGIPVKLVGLGEGAEDLVDFDPDEFVEAMFATS
jgi:fused signal recognition particle receptor